MSITWAPLELRKASNLRREVDEACKRFNEAIETGNKALEKELRRAFAERIDQLEDFYLRHDDDERAVLFEKQRLRLRRVLHTSHHTPTGGAAAGASRGVDGTDQPDAAAAAAEASAAGGATPSPARVGGGNRPSPTSATRQGRAASGGWAAPGKHGRFSVMGGIHHPASVPGAGTDKDKHGTPGTGTSSSKTRRDVAELYSWEKDGTGGGGGEPTGGEASPYGDDGAQHPLAGRNCSGSGEAGHYIDVGATVDPVIFDLQIVLNEAERKLLISRLRAKRAEDKHAARQRKAIEKAQGRGQESGEFLFSSSPYIEPSQQQDVLSRTPQKDKWVSSGGFNANSTSGSVRGGR